MLTKDQQLEELIRCSNDVIYFINKYCFLFDKEQRKWSNFILWDTPPGEYDNQVTVAKKISESRYLVILKARQLGITFIVLCVFLWHMLFNPVVSALLISRGETESNELLVRLKKIYSYLPPWMQSREVVTDNKNEFSLANGSSARSLSTRKGDSFAATHLLIDEADLVHESGIDLRDMLLKAEPTVGTTGTMVLLSKSDKKNPTSTFKKIYRAARKGSSYYTHAFLPYYVDPARDQKWYEEKTANAKALGTIDDLWENYPATPEQALAPNSQTKRFPYAVLEKCFFPVDPLDASLGIPNLNIWEMPRPGAIYVVLADASEGVESPETDKCGLMVMDVLTKSEVATFTGYATPAVLGSYVEILSRAYNDAACLPERNNHGHSLILWLKDNTEVRVLKGWVADGGQKKDGWATSSVAKSMMYNSLAETVANLGCVIRSEETLAQLASIEASTLRAPGKRGVDDLAVCFGLGEAAIEFCTLSVKIDFITVE